MVNLTYEQALALVKKQLKDMTLEEKKLLPLALSVLANSKLKNQQ